MTNPDLDPDETLYAIGLLLRGQTPNNDATPAADYPAGPYPPDAWELIPTKTRPLCPRCAKHVHTEGELCPRCQALADHPRPHCPRCERERCRPGLCVHCRKLLKLRQRSDDDGPATGR